jgi:hypothetical protein
MLLGRAALGAGAPALLRRDGARAAAALPSAPAAVAAARAGVALRGVSRPAALRAAPRLRSRRGRAQPGAAATAALDSGAWAAPAQLQRPKRARGDRRHSRCRGRGGIVADSGPAAHATSNRRALL